MSMNHGDPMWTLYPMQTYHFGTPLLARPESNVNAVEVVKMWEKELAPSKHGQSLGEESLIRSKRFVTDYTYLCIVCIMDTVECLIL